MISVASVRVTASARIAHIMLWLVLNAVIPFRLSEGKDPTDREGVNRSVPFDSAAAVRSLENHNPRPLEEVRGDGPDRYVYFDKSYNWSEYDRVLNEVGTLSAHAEEAFPDLVAHLNVDRYCTTLQYPGSSVDMASNESVGDVCRMMIMTQFGAAQDNTAGQGDISGNSDLEKASKGEKQSVRKSKA